MVKFVRTKTQLDKLSKQAVVELYLQQQKELHALQEQLAHANNCLTHNTAQTKRLQKQLKRIDKVFGFPLTSTDYE